jgi:hypothetical protein
MKSILSFLVYVLLDVLYKWKRKTKALCESYVCPSVLFPNATTWTTGQISNSTVETVTKSYREFLCSLILTTYKEYCIYDQKWTFSSVNLIIGKFSMRALCLMLVDHFDF